jgi:hypothetical protein
MYGYFSGYSVYPWAMYSLAAVSPVPEPPTMPAMGTPVPIPPNTLIFLGPQPEPPDKALKRQKEYLERLKDWADRYAKSIDEALLLVEKQEKALQRSQTQTKS